MQATHGRDESPKLFTPSDNYSTIQTLPTELLVEIFQHLGWEDILAIRRTCKNIFDVSTSRPLWVSLFYRLCNELQVPPILERPISAYTAAELEQVVMRRISSEIGWATGAKPRLTVFSPPDWPCEEGDAVVLLEGGRWILTCMNRDNWRVYAYDLDMPPSQEPRCVIDLELKTGVETDWRMSVSLDRNARPELAFNLCLAPCPDSQMPELHNNGAVVQIHIYRLTVKDNGTGTILEAHKFKSLGVRDEAEVIAIHGNYLVRCFNSYEYTYEVCNWLISDSDVRFKCYIDHANNVLLVPGGKLIAFTDSEVLVYDVTTLRPCPAGKIDATLLLQPYWRHTNVRLSGRVRYSQPHSDSHAARMALTIDGVIFGLTIPHDTNNKPCIRQICNINVSDTPVACIGINKMYAYDWHQSKADRKGIRTVNFPWPEEEEDVPPNVSLLLPTIRQSNQHHLRLPFRWQFPPSIDESSNRVLTFGHNSWAIVDFAYK